MTTEAQIVALDGHCRLAETNTPQLKLSFESIKIIKSR